MHLVADRPINTKGKRPHQQPRALWNGMIHPLVSYTFRGALWYQGESNRTQGLDYKDRLHALWNGHGRLKNDFGFPLPPFFLRSLDRVE